MNTDAYEIDEPLKYEKLGRLMDHRHMDNRGSIYNGSTKLITGLLSILNVLIASGVIGIIMMYGRLAGFEVQLRSVSDKVDMIIHGNIKIPHGEPSGP